MTWIQTDKHSLQNRTEWPAYSKYTRSFEPSTNSLPVTPAFPADEYRRLCIAGVPQGHGLPNGYPNGHPPNGHFPNGNGNGYGYGYKFPNGNGNGGGIGGNGGGGVGGGGFGGNGGGLLTPPNIGESI